MSMDEKNSMTREGELVPLDLRLIALSFLLELLPLQLQFLDFVVEQVLDLVQQGFTCDYTIP